MTERKHQPQGPRRQRLQTCLPPIPVLPGWDALNAGQHDVVQGCHGIGGGLGSGKGYLVKAMVSAHPAEDPLGVRGGGVS